MDATIYLLSAMMAYGTTFISVYIAEVIYDRYIRNYNKYRSLFGGATFGISLSVVIYIIERLSMTGVPDGRFTIVMLSTAFFGLIGGVTTFSIVLMSSVLNNYYETLFLVLNLITHMAIGCIIYKITRKYKKAQFYLNILGAIVGLLAAAVLANYTISTATEELDNLNGSLFLIFPLIVMFTFAISTVLIREQNRSVYISDLEKNKVQLTNQNTRIQTLFNDLVANQDELKEQYRKLDDTYNRLEHSELKYKLVLKASEEGFIEYTRHNHELIFSKKAIDILGLKDYLETKNNMQNKKYTMPMEKIFDFLDEPDLSKLKSGYQRLSESTSESLNLTLKFLNAKIGQRYIEYNGMVIREGDELVSIIGSVKDVNDKVKKQENIRRLAYRDKVTGLYNENALYNFIEAIMRSGRTGAVVFLKLVEFSHYSFLKSALKEKLQLHIAELIQANFESNRCYYLNDGIFCIVYESMTDSNQTIYESANHSYLNLNSNVNKSLLVNGINVPVTIYGSILEYPLKDMRADKFIRRGLMSLNSNTALNHTLEIFDETQYNNQYHLVRVEKLISSAIGNDELYMVYQPQYKCHECEPIGFEALIRWDSAEIGKVSPAEFIPIAEKNGTIIDIGHYVLNKVCRFMKEYFLLHDIYPHVSINVSHVELMDPEFANHFHHVVMAFKIPNQYVHIEITETAYAEYLEIVIKNVVILKELGYSIHLDDFGTGYSSLSQLGTLSIEVLKIDKSFIDKFTTDMNYYNLTVGIIELAHRLNMKVVAEGVELKEQYTVLQKVGCDYYQGYYFSKPIEEHLILGSKNVISLHFKN